MPQTRHRVIDINIAMANAMHMEIDADTSASPQLPQVQAEAVDGVLRLTLTGSWATHTIAAVDKVMRGHEAAIGGRAVAIDMSGITYFDTAGAWVVYRFAKAAEAAGQEASFEGIDPSHKVLLDAVRVAMEELAEQEPAEKPGNLLVHMLRVSAGRFMRFSTKS